MRLILGLCALTGVLIGLFVLAGDGLASTNHIYISQSGGGNGSSCSSPLIYTYFNSSGNWVAGAPAGTQIGPGTTVHVCGTITGAAGASGILNFQGSGTSGSPITLKFESGAGLSAPYCNWQGGPGACLIMSTPSKPHSYLVVDGGTPCGWTLATGSEGTCNGSIVNTANGVGLTYQSDTGGVEMRGCSNCELKNLGIYNLYQQSGGDTSAYPQGVNCVTFGSASNVLIHDNLMHDVGWCIYYIEGDGDNNVQVYNNEVYNTPHPVVFTGGSNSAAVATNAYFYSNHFHDFENWNTPSCTFHVEGFHGTGLVGSVFNGLYIYNNVWGPGSGNCLWADVYLAPNNNTAGSPAMSNNSAVFNNVIVVDGQGGEYGICVGGGDGNAVYNNTIINANTASGSTAEVGGALTWANISQNSGYTFTFMNNATQGFKMMVIDDDTGSEGPGITADYNAYSQCPGWGVAEGQCFQAFATDVDSFWTRYMANSYGQEQHSINTGLFPGGYCCNGTLGLGGNNQPTSASPLIGNGTSLYNLCKNQPNPGIGALCYDIQGNPRPISGPWTMGAFLGPPTVSPPTNLTATPH